jgi:hypothetical protein
MDKNWLRCAISLLLAVTVSSIRMPAQDGDAQTGSGEIRGVVVEIGTEQPIAGAGISVVLKQSGPELVDAGWSLESSVKITTDAAGAFAIPMKLPGKYRVEAAKLGYEAPARGRSAAQEVELEERYPVSEVKLFLGHYGALTGSVVDGDGKPIPDLRLGAVHENTSGMRFFPVGVDAKTDAEGRFVVASLLPGNYVAEVFPQTGAQERVLTAFTESDAEKMDLDYERTYWPGGHGAEAALPVTVSGGATVDVGTLRVRKVPYYRVHVRIPIAQCDPDGAMSVYETIQGSGSGIFNQRLGQAPCGKDILVTGHPSGAFRLLLRVAGENGASASVPFVIGDQNITVMAPVLADVTVEGAFLTADSAKAPDFTKLSVILSSTDGVGDASQPSPVESDGKFQIPYVRPVGQSVIVQGLGATHYVKEIRYNGIALSGPTLPLDQVAIASGLIIVLDDKPATIAGHVVASGGRASRPIVIAAKWPFDPTALGYSRSAQADAAGSFLITGLRPGEYRIIAIPSLSRDLMAVSQATIERVMAEAAKVELSPGELLNVTLEPAVF